MDTAVLRDNKSAKPICLLESSLPSSAVSSKQVSCFSTFVKGFNRTRAGCLYQELDVGPSTCEAILKIHRSCPDDLCKTASSII